MIVLASKTVKIRQMDGSKAEMKKWLLYTAVAGFCETPIQLKIRKTGVYG